MVCSVPSSWWGEGGGCVVATSPCDGQRSSPANHQLHLLAADCNPWQITGRRRARLAREKSWWKGGSGNQGCVGSPFPSHGWLSSLCWAAAAASLVSGVGKQLPLHPSRANGLTPVAHRQPGPILLGGWDTEGKQKKYHKVKQHHRLGQSPLGKGMLLTSSLAFPFRHCCCSYANDQ